MTLDDWTRYERTEAGMKHKENREALRVEFDEAIWPQVVALAERLQSNIGPFPNPGDYDLSTGRPEGEGKTSSNGPYGDSAGVQPAKKGKR